ncbi:MAG: hypothetical protein K2K80_00985 [Clostridia bacterium]|nr:hypothetical protein [Clostridia bacterium]
MAQSFEESLLETIIKDDIKEFNSLMEKARCGTYRLGRFPVPSLLYLYNARKILSAYEEKFLRITSFEPLLEPVEASKKFAKKAGKCLRLYLSEVVSPLEMLLIMDNTKRLTRVYPMTKPSSAVKARLKSIYSIRYSLNVGFEGDQIIIDKRPLSYREKKNILKLCLCSFLAVTIAVGVPVTTVALMPVEGEVTRLSQIDFNSDKEYTLKRDLTLPENYSVEKVNCTIKGEGNKIILSKGASLGEFGGKITDVTVESFGGAVFTSVSEKAVIENVTINVTADVTAAADTALVAVTNCGTIDGVTVNVSGKLNALAPSTEGTSLTFGGIVQTNAYVSANAYGIIKNCTVNYSQFELSGEVGADASFGGIAGINNGSVQDCTVTGEVVANTFDIAGVCSVNNGLLTNNVNEANLLQTAEDTGWNPMVGGIVLNNYSTVQYCKNSGALSSKGNASAYVGGICAMSYSILYGCLSSGDINAEAQNVYAGGILGCSNWAHDDYDNIFCGTANYCVSESIIDVTVENDAAAYVGGIVGFMQGVIVHDGESVFNLGGCVVGCYFIGTPAKEVSYFGNIVGVCKAIVYESPTYFAGTREYNTFKGNYYLANSSGSFGATLDEDGNFTEVEGKGAASAATEEIQNNETYKSILQVFEK